MTYWGNFTAKPRHSNAVFWPFGCIYQPNSPCLTLSAARTIPCNLLRTLMDETSQINWIIHARAFKVAWYTMQTLEVKGATTSSTWFWTDTRDVSRLLKTILLCYSLNFNVGTSLLQIKKNMLCYGSYLLSYSGSATVETSSIFSLLYGTMSCCKQGGNGPGSWTDLISHLDFCLVAINTATRVFLLTTILH